MKNMVYMAHDSEKKKVGNFKDLEEAQEGLEFFALNTNRTILERIPSFI